ncbi:MAG TPA: DUF3011 domain-containing protein [Pyrinomonadaceae bacterium]|nr:DUF3011 domain-containing protein [Pyrinomonadaceae bacterium]
MKNLRKFIALKMAVFIMLASLGTIPAVAQSNYLTCGSNNNNYNYCRVNTGNNVRLERKLSYSSCNYGYDWGYDGRGIWVNNGCRAEFSYGGGSGKAAAIAGGAVLGGVILAAVIAAKKKKDAEKKNEDEEASNNDTWDSGHEYVPSYLVGSFRGWNPDLRSYSDLTVGPSGAISVRNSNGQYQNGRYDNGSIKLPWGRYEVERNGDGFAVRNSNGESYNFLRIR